MTSLNGSEPKKELMAHFNFHLQPGPDGKPWCKVTIVLGGEMAAGSFLINQDTIEQWGAELPGTFRELIMMMKSAAAGLVVANPNDIRNLKKPGEN